MIEIIENYSKRDTFESKLRITINPNDIYDLQIAMYTRIFLFEEASAHLSIDFVKQDIVPGCLYIVPPMHFFHLSKIAGNFLCIDLNYNQMKEPNKHWLYGIKYKKQKKLKLQDEIANSCNYVDLAKLALGSANSRLVAVVNNWMKIRTPSIYVEQGKQNNFAKMNMAEGFLDLLANKKLTLDNCNVNVLAAEMYCTARNLHRMCTSVFGYNARNICSYHLSLKALFLLSNRELSFSDIAFDLNFSNTTSFNHFIKNLTGMTPSMIRSSSAIML